MDSSMACQEGSHQQGSCVISYSSAAWRRTVQYGKLFFKPYAIQHNIFLFLSHYFSFIKSCTRKVQPAITIITGILNYYSIVTKFCYELTQHQ